MEAVQFTAKTKKLELIKAEIPPVATDDGVLVKVAYSGICGTDLHIIEGQFPCKQTAPFYLGHEFCGTVVAVGKAVKSVKKGDRVVVDPNNGCHVCNVCHSGNPHYCQEGGIENTMGIHRNGGWAEYCIVPAEQIQYLPDNITLEQAALCEPISCIAHGWDRISPVPVGQKILIVGAGIIGNLWAITLHLQGHRDVTVSEPNSSRLRQVEKLQTGYDLITPEELKARHDRDNSYLFDLIIDCSGFGPAIEYAATLLACGGTLCIFGVAPPTTKISISPFAIYKQESRIIGCNINPFTFPKALGLLSSFGDRYLNYGNLGIKIFQLKDYKEAIELLHKGTISKAVFKI